MIEKNLAASVRQRLLNLAKVRGEDFDFVLRQYTMQRFLYRLSISEYSNNFLLKGALLFWVWQEQFHRPTRDIDLLGFGGNDEGYLRDVFCAICKIEAQDGLSFDPESIQSIQIKENAIYRGVRITGAAHLEKARIPLQIDIGFGDAVTPAPEQRLLPSFLDFPPVTLRVYPVYTVIAEKFQAMVALDVLNSRLKDYYDLWVISSSMLLDGKLMVDAVKETFARRNTLISHVSPNIFSESFSKDTNKHVQWKAFLNKNRLQNDMEFAHVMALLQPFLLPVYTTIAEGITFKQQWEPYERAWRDG